MLDHILAFAAVFGLDVAFAYYVITIARRQALASAGWAALIMGFNGYLAIAWNATPATVPAAMLGAAVGTWASLRLLPNRTDK